MKRTFKLAMVMALLSSVSGCFVSINTGIPLGPLVDIGAGVTVGPGGISPHAGANIGVGLAL